MITDIVRQMKQVADEFPFDPRKGLLIDDKLSREFVYEGYPIRVILTLTYLSGKGFYIISFKDKTSNKLPEDIIDKIKKAFFNSDKEIIELPKLIGPDGIVIKFGQFK